MNKPSIVDHRFEDAEYFASEYREDRKTPLSLIVIHSMSLPEGGYGNGYCRDLFTGKLDYNAHPSFASLRGLRVSAHLLILRDGSIQQFVPFSEVAWHAGQSSYKGRSGCNAFSIGIELEGSKEDEFEKTQYEKLAAVCNALCRVYRIDKTNIVGHNDISPRRKTDPWNFNWERFRDLLHVG